MPRKHKKGRRTDLFLIDGSVTHPKGAKVKSFGNPAIEEGSSEHADHMAIQAQHEGPHLKRTILETFPMQEENWAERDKHMRDAVRYATAKRAKVVNISMGKDHPTPRTIKAIRNHPKTLFLIGSPKGKYYPADYKAKNVLRVGNYEGAQVENPSYDFPSEATLSASVYAARVAKKHPNIPIDVLKRAIRERFNG